MSLKEGTKLGPYEIVAPIGAGGMGEVWRARDASLDRDVAIKVLPAAMTQDPERIARFEREAKLLASLNHGNIAVIHGFDDTNGIHYLVMEYVEGETLSQRLESGALTVEEALRIAKQIAEALEAAHGQGVIHRDLKPGNVMIRPDRSVKVLDFGLAKSSTAAAAGSTDANSPTITADYTTPGVVLGTAAYMSPEQARGRPLDKRTDIWSFGVILFECLTGDRLFKGDTATDSMGAIMHKEPDWTRLPPGTPPTIQLLLRRCLTKDRRRRLHDIADARVEIEEALTDPSSSSLGLVSAAVTEKVRGGARRVRALSVIAAFVLGALIVGGIALRLRAPSEPGPVRRFEFAQDLEPRNAVISPDGTIVAFSSSDSVYVRELDAVETRLLWAPGNGDEIRALFWSPDSEWLGAQAGTAYWRLAITGGQAIEMTDQPATFGPRWSDDGHIILNNFGDGSIVQVPDRGGAPRTLLSKNEDEVHLHGGSPLPGGRGILLVPHPVGGDATVLTILTAEGDRRVLHESHEEIWDPKYSTTGHILYSRSGQPRGVWALPFSLETLKVTGDPFLVLPDHGACSVSSSGDLVYARGSRSDSEAYDLVWVDRSGEVLTQVGPTLFGARELSLSRDGRRVAVAMRGLTAGADDATDDIWIVDLRRGVATRLASEDDQQTDPTWSPDDSRIAYHTFRTLDDVFVRVRAADGAGQSELFIEDAYSFSMNDDWSMAAVMVGNIVEDTWIATQRLDDDASRREFQRGDGWDADPSIRPGGGLIAYLSGDLMAGELRVFLRRFPEGGGRWQVSMNPAGDVRWSRAGDRLYFIEEDGSARTLMEMSVRIDGDRVVLGDTTPLFSMSDNRFRSYDVSPDGERFLMLQEHPDSDEGPAKEGVMIVQNWFEEFRAIAK